MTETPFEPDAAEGWIRDQAKIPFMQLVGPIFYRTKEDGYEYGFVSRPDTHGNLYGRLHGGMTAAFADYALGHACHLDSSGAPNVTIHLGLDYIQAGMPGDWIHCDVEFVRKTRSLRFMRADIYAEDVLIATANGIWKSVPVKA